MDVSLSLSLYLFLSLSRSLSLLLSLPVQQPCNIYGCFRKKPRNIGLFLQHRPTCRVLSAERVLLYTQVQSSKEHYGTGFCPIQKNILFKKKNESMKTKEKGCAGASVCVCAFEGGVGCVGGGYLNF